MRVKDFLPSSKFAFILGSIALSAGLVFAAERITHTPSASNTTDVASGINVVDDWKQTLAEIQSQNTTALPQPPSESAVQTLLGAATSDNLTNTVARTLFIKLSNAKSQGLGGDIPTQDSLIAEAAAKVAQERGSAHYTLADLKTTGSSQSELHDYGNAVMSLLTSHTNASPTATFIIIGLAIDAQDSKKLAPLAAIGAEYKTLAEELVKVPVPKTLTPLHLSVVNNFARLASTFPDLEVLITDPLRGLGGLQLFQSLTDETKRVLTTLAVTLTKDGILFNKDEPGSSWALLVP